MSLVPFAFGGAVSFTEKFTSLSVMGYSNLLGVTETQSLGIPVVLSLKSDSVPFTEAVSSKSTDEPLFTLISVGSITISRSLAHGCISGGLFLDVPQYFESVHFLFSLPSEHSDQAVHDQDS